MGVEQASLGVVVGAEVEEVAAEVDRMDTTLMMVLMAPMVLHAGALLLLEIQEIQEVVGVVEAVAVAVAVEDTAQGDTLEVHMVEVHIMVEEYMAAVHIMVEEYMAAVHMVEGYMAAVHMVELYMVEDMVEENMAEETTL